MIRVVAALASLTILSLATMRIFHLQEPVESSAKKEAENLLSWVESGDEVQIGRESSKVTCSLTIITQEKALTAGHCGQSGDEVWSKGRKIGGVGNNYLFMKMKVDVAEIFLHSPSSDYSIEGADFTSAQLNIPSHLVSRTFFGGRKMGNIQNNQLSCQGFVLDGKSYEAYTYVANLDSKPGDSGAPVYNSDGYLVALIEGGDGKGHTTITPISFLWGIANEAPEENSGECSK